jgi:hypothetical protein
MTADVQKRADFAAFQQAHPEYNGSYEQWVTEQAATGKAAAPKQSMTPRPGMSGGKNVFALLTSAGWVDAGTRQPLKDFRPPPTFAETGLYGVEPMQNPDGSLGSALLNRRTGQFKPITGQGGTPIAPSMMAQVNQSLEPAIAGDTRLTIMQQNLKDALANPEDQQAMLSLVANHIGMTLGAQKGARINQAVWNEAVQSAPWLQNVAAKWGPDGYLQGVTLTPGQMKQMVVLAKQRRDAQWKQAAQAGAMYGVNVPVPDDVGGGASKGPAPMAAQGGGGQGKKVVSLAKARNLPQYKGKSDAEITAAAKTLGYEVKP